MKDDLILDDLDGSFVDRAGIFTAQLYTEKMTETNDDHVPHLF